MSPVILQDELSHPRNERAVPNMRGTGIITN